MAKRKPEAKSEPKVTRPRSVKKTGSKSESRPSCPVCNGPTVSAYLDKGRVNEIVICDTPSCANYRKYIKGR